MKHLAALAILLLTTACQKQTATRTTRADVAKEASSEIEGSQDERPYYRYSVVAGGVYSQKEALQRIASDAVVREHYEPIAADRLSPRINDRDRDVYVSYRVGQNVYWTSKPVKLKKNEMVLTDGVNEVRTRCGNRIAEAPQGPVNTAVEPQPDVFDTKVQKADADFPAEVKAGVATPLGGIVFPQVSPVTSSLPAPNPLPAPSPVTVAGGSGGGGVRGGGGGGGGGMAGGGGGGGVVPVSPDGATWPGYFGNPYLTPGILVLQMGGNPATYVTNVAGAVYNYSTTLILPEGTPSVGSVVYSPTFGNTFTSLTTNFISSSQLAFGGLQPAPVLYNPPSFTNVTNVTNVNNNTNNSGGANPGTPGATGTPGTPGMPGTPGTPGTGTPGDGPGPNTAVPEPGTLGMVALATLVTALITARQRHREKKSSSEVTAAR